jgi:hypothetical protein
MFQPDIIPIIWPSIDWNNYLQGVLTATGIRPTKDLDSHIGILSDSARFLASLSKFQHPELTKDVLAAIRDSRSILNHLSYTFLVSAEKEVFCQIGQRTKLTVTSQDDIAIISGTLAEWKSASLEFLLYTECDFNIRLLFDKIILLFEHAGLGDLWFGYNKESLKDKTFILKIK